VLDAQMPIETKLTLADVVFWNEGTENLLRKQCQRFLESLNLLSASTLPPNA